MQTPQQRGLCKIPVHSLFAIFLGHKKIIVIKKNTKELVSKFPNLKKC